MKIKLGFAKKSSVIENPHITIEFNGQLIKTDIELDDCGCADDLSAKLQYIEIDAPIDDSIDSEHWLIIYGLNLFDKYKTNGDFGIQLRYIEINNINLDYFSLKETIAYNPIPDESYIDFYLKKHDKLHELEIIDGKKIHVTRGNYANYINLEHGRIEFKFKTPIYFWLLENNFGKIPEALILDF
jgi:hypothetical protein